MPKKIVYYSMLSVLIVIIGLVALLDQHNSPISNQVLQKRVKRVDVTVPSTKHSTSNIPEPTKNPSGGGMEQSESTDTNGQGEAKTPANDWVTSDSGNITLQQPIAGSTLSSGAIIVGTATTIKTVDYRLSDDSVGVLTQGSFNVVNGKFSGILYFSSKSTSGQLDIFSTNTRGVELNEIQIGVKF